MLRTGVVVSVEQVLRDSTSDEGEVPLHHQSSQEDNLGYLGGRLPAGHPHAGCSGEIQLDQRLSITID